MNESPLNLNGSTHFHWPLETAHSGADDLERTSFGLVNLDKLYPCTRENPCILDRLITEDIMNFKHRASRELFQKLLGDSRKPRDS